MTKNKNFRYPSYNFDGGSHILKTTAYGTYAVQINDKEIINFLLYNKTDKNRFNREAEKIFHQASFKMLSSET